MRAHGQALRRPVRGHGHGGVATDVEQRGEGRGVHGLAGVALKRLIQAQHTQLLRGYGGGGREYQVVVAEKSVNQLRGAVKAQAGGVQLLGRGLACLLQRGPVQRLHFVFAHAAAQQFFALADGVQHGGAHGRAHAAENFLHRQLQPALFQPVAQAFAHLGRCIERGQAVGMYGHAEMVAAPHGNAQRAGGLGQGCQVAAGGATGRQHARTGFGAGTQVQQQGAVAHAAADGVVGRQAQRAFHEHRACGGAAPAGFEAKQPAVRSWNTDGATAIAGMGQRHNASGHGGGCAARGAAGGVGRVPGVGCDAVQTRLGGRRHAKFWRGSFAKNVQASRLVALHQGAAVRGHGPLEKGAAMGGDGALQALPQVFEQERHAPQWCVGTGLRACGLAEGGELFRLLARQLEIADDHGVEPGQGFDPGNRCIQRLQRRDVAARYLLRPGGGVGRWGAGGAGLCPQGQGGGHHAGACTLQKQAALRMAG